MAMRLRNNSSSPAFAPSGPAPLPQDCKADTLTSPNFADMQTPGKTESDTSSALLPSGLPLAFLRAPIMICWPGASSWPAARLSLSPPLGELAAKTRPCSGPVAIPIIARPGGKLTCLKSEQPFASTWPLPNCPWSLLPHANTTPSRLSSSEWELPKATAFQWPGRSRKAQLSFNCDGLWPNWPWSLLPVSRHRWFFTMTAECRPPAAILRAGSSNAETRRGSSTASGGSGPKPNLPCFPQPQASTPPPTESASECWAPAAMARTGKARRSPESTGIGCADDSVAPEPSAPQEPSPKAKMVPATVSRSECASPHATCLTWALGAGSTTALGPTRASAMAPPCPS
mmetsp:Transcript_97851/g.315007  ORF Transcript_97851/g.315007 Transcript_97851/m.315007 type:complete len:344 (-) Transcript_97851:479-1510(-)